ncbi:hypothetical protein FSARC_8486 [Fusarium sarcochroum]|uniref:Uncharacterized protein n=1 Tax=Fusarium sarcochroum TaxID=1208366 RepID=A0A8H4TT78_9HYPO|nr:hypothetical protein FSARC_8486 [Fusarium sarcochroum]
MASKASDIIKRRAGEVERYYDALSGNPHKDCISEDDLARARNLLSKYEPEVYFDEDKQFPSKWRDVDGRSSLIQVLACQSWRSLPTSLDGEVEEITEEETTPFEPYEFDEIIEHNEETPTAGAAMAIHESDVEETAITNSPNQDTISCSASPLTTGTNQLPTLDYQSAEYQPATHPHQEFAPRLRMGSQHSNRSRYSIDDSAEHWRASASATARWGPPGKSSSSLLSGAPTCSGGLFDHWSAVSAPAPLSLAPIKLGPIPSTAVERLAAPAATESEPLLKSKPVKEGYTMSFLKLTIAQGIGMASAEDEEEYDGALESFPYSKEDVARYLTGLKKREKKEEEEKKKKHKDKDDVKEGKTRIRRRRKARGRTRSGF